MADDLQSSDELLTADIGPARWGASEVSPALRWLGWDNLVVLLSAMSVTPLGLVD